VIFTLWVFGKCRVFGIKSVVSVAPPKADIGYVRWDVRFVPKADISVCRSIFLVQCALNIRGRQIGIAGTFLKEQRSEKSSCVSKSPKHLNGGLRRPPDTNDTKSMTDDIVAVSKEIMVVGASLMSGANNVRQHCLPCLAATKVTHLQSDHPHRRHHGHDLRGQRRRPDHALSTISRNLRPHAVHPDDHLRCLCAQPSRCFANRRLALGLYRPQAGDPRGVVAQRRRHGHVHLSEFCSGVDCRPRCARLCHRSPLQRSAPRSWTPTAAAGRC